MSSSTDVPAILQAIKSETNTELFKAVMALIDITETSEIDKMLNSTDEEVYRSQGAIRVLRQLRVRMTRVSTPKQRDGAYR